MITIVAYLALTIIFPVTLLAQAPIQIDCSTGRVGIGQSPGAQRLAVNGGIQASSNSYLPSLSTSALYSSGTYGSVTLSSSSVLSVNGTHFIPML
jgi:hypothetical protein